MNETFYIVRRLINGREGCRPSEFPSKEAAMVFINALKDMETGNSNFICEYHLYEVKEIEH